MDYKAYQQKYFLHPPPAPRFHFNGLFGITLFYESYEKAVGYYTRVLGQPAYAEGQFTRGWQIGHTWLTILKARNGNPTNVEVAIVMPTPQEAEALQTAFIDAGGAGQPPQDQLMYIPIRSCPVTDPFGTPILIYSPL